MHIPHNAGEQSLLAVSDLSIAFPSSGGLRHVTEMVGFTLEAGHSLAVVGESGSGKTMVGRALLGLLPHNAHISSGSVRFENRELLGQTPDQWRRTRGTDIGMVFQEPMVSLNPAMRIGNQLTEALILRRNVPREMAAAQAIAMLERVKVRDPRGSMRQYPHEFSGGMRQRILLAAVMLLRPKLLIADEPTTALDCIVQKEVLDLMLELTREERTALIFISHNLALVSAYTERVLVMRRGCIVETGPVVQVLAHPSHDYTLSLLEALPRRVNNIDLEVVEPQHAAPTVSLQQVSIDYTSSNRLFGRQTKRVVYSTSIDIPKGKTVAIVGESGSGKTSLAKAILGLIPLSEGKILLDGEPYLGGSRQAMRTARRRIQMVFQDPYSSLDPRMSVGDLVTESLRLDRELSKAERTERVATALADVGLASYSSRLVHQLSGGQRQRIAIAHALVSRPDIIIADEPVSALDVTVQKQILDILVGLQKRYGFACLLISHDLGVVEQIADRVYVMFHGHVVEEGSRDQVFDHPTHPYTRRLLQAVPELRGDRERGFKVLTRPIPDEIDAARQYFDGADGGSLSREMIEVATSAQARHRVAVASIMAPRAP